MTRRSKYLATSVIPRVLASAPDDSQMRLLLDAVLLGFGECNLTITKPNGEQFLLNVNYMGGANHMFTEQTEQ